MDNTNADPKTFMQLRIVKVGRGFRVDFTQDGMVWEPMENTLSLERAKKVLMEYLDILQEDQVLYETPKISTEYNNVH